MVSGIGLDAPPVSPPAGLRARVLDRVATEKQTTHARGPLPFAKQPERSGFSGARLALAASVILAIGASFYALALRSELASLRDIVATNAAETSKLRTELVNLRRNMDVMKAPDMLKVDLKGQTPMPGATGRAFWSRTAGLMFTADQLPPLAPGRVYQLWTITGGTPASAGVFTPNAQGGATVSVAIASGAALPDAFGVTIEPTGGSTTPTLPIVLMGGR